MKTYTCVTQISAKTFGVEKHTGDSLRDVRTNGILVAARESNDMNDVYCDLLAKQMTSELN